MTEQTERHFHYLLLHQLLYIKLNFERKDINQYFS